MLKFIRSWTSWQPVMLFVCPGRWRGAWLDGWQGSPLRPFPISSTSDHGTTSPFFIIIFTSQLFLCLRRREEITCLQSSITSRPGGPCITAVSIIMHQFVGDEVVHATPRATKQFSEIVPSKFFFFFFCFLLVLKTNPCKTWNHSKSCFNLAGKKSL